jgi:hypothetical protein
VPSRAVIIAIAVLALLFVGGFAAQAVPPPAQGVMHDPYTISEFQPAPADGQLHEFARTCNPGDVVTGWAARFITGTETRPEFDIAGRLEVNDPNRAIVWWRDNPVGGEAGSVEVDVRCAIVS